MMLQLNLTVQLQHNFAYQYVVRFLLNNFLTAHVNYMGIRFKPGYWIITLLLNGIKVIFNAVLIYFLCEYMENHNILIYSKVALYYIYFNLPAFKINNQNLTLTRKSFSLIIYIYISFKKCIISSKNLICFSLSINNFPYSLRLFHYKRIQNIK